MSRASRLILASASAARRTLLASAGLDFDVVTADVDEAALRRSMGDVDAETIAVTLAAEKASVISLKMRDAVVIGADQVLALEGRIFNKAQDLAEAREILQSLRGRTHELISGIAMARGGNLFWQTSAKARMTMRDFSDGFLDAYLERVGVQALRSVGCYELEGLGIQLFDHIDGDYFTILGLPLLPLLARLRQEELVPA